MAADAGSSTPMLTCSLVSTASGKTEVAFFPILTSPGVIRRPRWAAPMWDPQRPDKRPVLSPCGSL